MDQAIKEPTCDNVDIQGLEDEALYAVSNVQDLMMNVDLTNSQFSL